VPHASDVPLVVRKDPERGCYTLVGECYIDGMMYYDKLESCIGPLPDEVVLHLV
jgi:hypothetical protein